MSFPGCPVPSTRLRLGPTQAFALLTRPGRSKKKASRKKRAKHFLILEFSRFFALLAPFKSSCRVLKPNVIVAMHCRHLLSAGATLFGALVSLPAIGQVPYFTDFENGVGPEWSLSSLESAETNYFTRFTGRFSNEAQTLTLTNLTVGQSYSAGFDFYVIDSWDGHSGPGDYFNVSIATTQGTNQIFHETFRNYNGNPPNVPLSYT